MISKHICIYNEFPFIKSTPSFLHTLYTYTYSTCIFIVHVQFRGAFLLDFSDKAAY